MTEQEAIRDLGLLRIFDAPDLDKALDLAVKALEKQVPKKPKDKGKFADLYIGLCPVCNEGMNSEQNYCLKCGAKIDWEEE